MRVFPYRRFTIDTRLAPAEVQARLRDAVEPPRFRAFARPERPLVGRVDGTSFDVMRNVYGRNSFRPRVRGTIEAGGTGTRITGTMQVHEIVMLFIGALLLAAVSVLLSMAARDIASRQLDPVTLAPLGVVVLLIAMTLVGFIPETGKVLGELVRLVDGTHAELG